MGEIPVGGQVLLSTVPETSVVPLPTSLLSSDVLPDPVFIEPFNSVDESQVEVHPVSVICYCVMEEVRIYC